jgi:GNAT superfamily N-acetyltransferase
MKEKIEYHLATLKDLDIVIKMNLRFAHEFNGIQNPDIEAILLKSKTDYFKKELNNNYLSWYATVNKQVASIAGLIVRHQLPTMSNHSGIWGYIICVYTLPEYRRRGLSKNILQRLTNTAKEMGITALELHASKDGEHVYIKEGFQIYNEPTYRKFIMTK